MNKSYQRLHDGENFEIIVNEYTKQVLVYTKGKHIIIEINDDGSMSSTTVKNLSDF